MHILEKDLLPKVMKAKKCERYEQNKDKQKAKRQERYNSKKNNANVKAEKISKEFKKSLDMTIVQCQTCKEAWPLAAESWKSNVENVLIYGSHVVYRF